MASLGQSRPIRELEIKIAGALDQLLEFQCERFAIREFFLDDLERGFTLSLAPLGCLGSAFTVEQYDPVTVDLRCPALLLDLAIDGLDVLDPVGLDKICCPLAPQFDDLSLDRSQGGPRCLPPLSGSRLNSFMLCLLTVSLGHTLRGEVDENLPHKACQRSAIQIGQLLQLGPERAGNSDDNLLTADRFRHSEPHARQCLHPIASRPQRTVPTRGCPACRNKPRLL